MADWQTLARAQGGVVTRRQLTASGVSERRLGTVAAPKALVKVRHGVFVDGAAWAQADEVQRIAYAVAAERLRSGADLVAAGRTAALLHKLPVLGRQRGLHLVERKQVRPSHHGVSRLVLEVDVEEVLGVPTTSLARTAVDVARKGFAGGVVTVDAVLRRGVPREDLELAVDVSRRWPGRLTALAAVGFADPLAETALESLGRARMHEAGLPTPESQVWIGDADGPFARVDHCWRDRRVVAEADGALKYTDRSALFEEKRREDRIREAGFQVVRYTWDEMLRTPDLVMARIRRAFIRAAAA